MFQTLELFDAFNRHLDKEGRSDAQHCDIQGTPLAVQGYGTFFRRAAAALQVLGSQLTLEFVCGGMAEELTKMRVHASADRPRHFPVKFTRMWMSDVP